MVEPVGNTPMEKWQSVLRQCPGEYPEIERKISNAFMDRVIFLATLSAVVFFAGAYFGLCGEMADYVACASIAGTMLLIGGVIGLCANRCVSNRSRKEINDDTSGSLLKHLMHKQKGPPTVTDPNQREMGSMPDG